MLITGGSSGIGLAAARMFAREGAHVVIAARDRERLAEAGRQVAADADGGSVLALSGDFSDPAVPARVVEETISKLQRVDVLVNNVGLAYQAAFEEVTDQQWEDLWQLNVMSFVRAIRAVVPSMRAQRSGCIVNVSSTAGKRPSIGMPNYSVTKAAVLSLSRLVADTYASDGIRSVAVCPGPTATEAWLAPGGLAEQVASGKQITREQALEATGAGRPLGRLAEPDEIASMIVFAASAQASYVTGAALGVDGGSVPVII